MSDKNGTLYKEIEIHNENNDFNMKNRSQKEIYNEAKKRYKIVPKEEIPEFVYVPPSSINTLQTSESEREE
jgi:hypothetical protein